MKRIFIICLAVIIIVLSGCSSKSNIDVNSQGSANLEDNIYSSVNSEDNIADSVNSKDNNTALVYSGHLSFLSGKTVIETTGFGESVFTADLESFFPKSDAIVLAKVSDITYKAIPGTGGAWTVADIDILKSYKGDFKEGDKLDVYYIGGYISVEDHIKLNDNAFRFEDMTDEEKKNTYFHEVIDGEANDPIGKTYLFCLIPTLEGSPLPKDSYERISVFSQMLYDEKDNVFVQTINNAEKTYTEEEIIKAVAEYK